MLRTVILAALALACLSSVAEARHYRAQPGNQIGCSQPDMRPCTAVSPLQRTRNRRHSGSISVAPLHRPHVIGSRPSGCPHRYCGCALSLKLFGRIIPRLNLAANWLAFPRALPAGGMVAARHGHVFLLKEHISGSTWLAWDPNSGRGRTRLHARSIAGFRIIDPHGSRMAAQ